MLSDGATYPEHAADFYKTLVSTLNGGDAVLFIPAPGGRVMVAVIDNLDQLNQLKTLVSNISDSVSGSMFMAALEHTLLKVNSQKK